MSFFIKMYEWDNKKNDNKLKYKKDIDDIF